MKTSRVIFIGLTAIALVWLLAFLFTNPETIAPFFNALLMMGMPLLLGIFLTRKIRTSWRLFGIGTLAFVGSQILHIPFNEFLLKPLLESTMQAATPGSPQLMLVGLAFGLSAGIFEETARAIVYRKWQAEDTHWANGLMLGAGHGGIEAIIFGALAMYVFLQMVVLKGVDPGLIGELVGPGQLETTTAYLEQYWATPWHDALLGALERLSAITMHLSLSLLVLQAFRRKNWGWFALAVLWHTAINAVAVYGITTWSVYLTEAILLGMALVSLGVVFALRQPLPEPEEPEDSGLPPSSPDEWPVKPAEITSEKLDESRYD